MTEKSLVLGYAPWGTGQARPFDKIFTGGSINCREKGFENIDVFVLWGGTDIHPSLYKEKAHPSNEVAEKSEPTARDLFEWGAIKHCVANNIPILGVCRGAQMLCAAAGGKLVQHCYGHSNGPHEMETSDGEVLVTNSYHHQMMNPYFEDVSFKLLAWSKEKLSSKYYAHNNFTEYNESKTRPEPEVVFFPKLKALAIQGHPEWMSDESPFVQKCFSWVSEYLIGE